MTAQVFAYGEGRVLKLFRAGIPREWALYEHGVAKAAREAGAPAPGVHGAFEVDGRMGIEYGRVPGPSMLALMTARPWTMAGRAREMARLHSSIHGLRAAGLPSQKERMARMIGEALPEGDPLRAPALARMDGLPEGDRVCHGDLHPDNILCGGEKLVVIDWMNACAGDPAADAARTVLMLRSPHMPPGVPAYVRLLSRLFKKIVLGAYLKEYLRSGLAGRGEIEAWMPAVAAARLAEGLPGEGPWLRGLVEGGKPWER